MRQPFLCRVVAVLTCGSALLASGVLRAQQRPESGAPAQGRPDAISIPDVCAAALPRAAEGEIFQWSPDGRSIAYFKPVATGIGLRLELDAVDADGGGGRVLLASRAIDHLFPAKPVGHHGQLVPPPKAAVGFQWSADGRGLLLYSDLHLYWLDAKTLETKSLLDGEQPISDVQLSPDGRYAAFVRGHNLWAVKTTGGPEWPVTRGGGETLRKGELDWMYPAELGAKHGYAWSPDSARIAYLEFNLEGVASYTPPFQLAEDRPAPTIDYPTPGAKNPQVRAFVVGVLGKSPAVAIDTGSDTDIYLPRLQWLPEGKQLALERLNRAQSQVDLLLADPSKGTTRILLTDTDPYWINLSDILYFFKGAPQFLWSSERSGYRHLYLYGLDGKLIRQVTDGAWEVTSLDAVDERARKIYYTSTEYSPLERHLYAIGLDGQGAKRVSAESGTHQATFAPDASAYVDTFSTAIKPWSRAVYKPVVNPASGAGAPMNSRQATKLFAFDDTPATSAKPANYGVVHFVTAATHDGVKLNALVIQPAGFSPEKKYPAVVYVEGGPGSQAVRDVWKGDISLWEQLLAQRGFVVFAVDNRGTAGRGHLFEEYLHYRFAAIEMTDLQDSLEFLRSLRYVDSARLGVFGRGYGGLISVKAMLQPHLGFKAGFAVAPVVDWFHYDSAFAERYLGSVVTNQDGYLTSSPLDDARSLKNSLLVAQGTADLLTHPDQAMELQHELVEARKHAEISLYPGQGHTIDGPDACVVSYQGATDFFAKSM